jgi:hypothetical protein
VANPDREPEKMQELKPKTVTIKDSVPDTRDVHLDNAVLKRIREVQAAQIARVRSGERD